MVVIDADKSFGFSTPRELWEFKELLYFLVWRQVMVRYKQTIIGIIWVILQPLVSVAVLTVVFNVFLNVDSGDIPYPIFLLSALIFWRYFVSALTLSGQSLVDNAHMISKVYFPRIFIPVASCISPLVDFVLAFIVLIVLMPFFGMMPSAQLLFAPIFVLLSMLTALSISLWLSALNVRYRDINHVIPFLLQIWMYLVPIIYPIDAVPPIIRPVYSLNPMVGVIEGARWSVLGMGSAPNFLPMAIGAAVVFTLLIGGFFFFHRMERSFADVI